MAFGLAVYASPGGLPRLDARLASSRWSDATGRASTRRVPTKGFRGVIVTSLPPPPTFAGRNHTDRRIEPPRDTPDNPELHPPRPLWTPTDVGDKACFRQQRRQRSTAASAGAAPNATRRGGRGRGQRAGRPRPATRPPPPRPHAPR